MILDTNALFAVADGDRSILRHFLEADSVAIPVIVLGEYRFGISQSKYRSEYERWLTEASSKCEILDITAGTADHYAVLRTELKRSGKAVPSNDLWIAALCREHSRSLLSRDQHFDVIRGLRRLTW